jgi:hypothetical protein
MDLLRKNKRGGRLALRLVMRIVMPSLMVGFGVFTVANHGVQGLLALLPILGAHVVGFVVVFPLWIRFQRRRQSRLVEQGGNDAVGTVGPPVS